MIEILVAIGIFAFLVGAVTALFLSSFRSKDIIFEQLLTQNQGRKVVQDFINEIRSAAYSAVGAYPLVEASSTEIIFYTNQGKSAVRRVRYFLSNKTLYRGIIEPIGNPPSYPANSEVTSTVAESINNGASTLFNYYDQNYSGSQNPMIAPVDITAVRIVEIKFQLERNPNLSPTALNMQAQAEIRNLKSN